MTVLRAWKALQKLRRDELALQELPMAAAQALFANANRDPKRGKPFAPKDFCLFAQRDEEQRPQVPPEVAAVALALRHEGKAPPIVIAAWPQLIAGASATVKVPSVRALRSDDDRVWVLCPSWEGQNIRGGLVATCGNAAGRIILRDLDRPLATYEVQIPRRPLAGWLESGLLLAGATSKHEHPVAAD